MKRPVMIVDPKPARSFGLIGALGPFETPFLGSDLPAEHRLMFVEPKVSL
jgi:hypothetical protein